MQKPNLPILFALGAILLPILSGCALSHRVGNSVHQYWMDETGSQPGERNNEDPKLINYEKASDYIPKDGSLAIAIPARSRFDLYISPYAPNKYFKSKEPVGAVVYCPYTGHPLLIPNRDVYAEKELL